MLQTLHAAFEHIDIREPHVQQVRLIQQPAHWAIVYDEHLTIFPTFHISEFVKIEINGRAKTLIN